MEKINSVRERYASTYRVQHITSTKTRILGKAEQNRNNHHNPTKMKKPELNRKSSRLLTELSPQNLKGNVHKAFLALWGGSFVCLSVG